MTEAKIVKYPKQKQLNIGIVIFGTIFIYLVATIIMYITAPRISVYEVRQGSILKDNAYTGLAIRKESIVYADSAGYINYYVEDSSKVRVGTDVYTLSEEKLTFKDTVSDEESPLTQEERHSLTYKIQAYNEQFDENNFSSTYQFTNELSHTLNMITNKSKTNQLHNILAEGNVSSLTMRSSEKDGIIVYAVDGLEEFAIEDISAEQLKKTNYRKTEFSGNNYVKEGEPIYKIVTDNKWQLLIEVTDETKKALEEMNTVKVNFKKDNQEMRGSLSFLEGTKTNIACLSFSDSMIRYVTDRYLDIELILEDESGLKIPKSAETSKEFYVVPKSYITMGGNSSSDGVMRQTSNVEGVHITEFLPVTVYYEEEEYVYLDPNVFQKGDVLLKPDSSETLKLNEKRSLKGVYCINKGYAVFKQIEILCESAEYYIIKEGSAFGLSNYDHIALDSLSIKENDVVF